VTKVKAVMLARRGAAACILIVAKVVPAAVAMDEVVMP
jgi:hypothetical protein